MSESQPIQRRKLYHEVADRILERIRSGEFEPGDRLPSEREFMEQYQVGRPAVREAMLTIERMGLISIVHGERARVLVPTAQTMMDQMAWTASHILSTSPQHRGYLREARLFFETGMVRIAAENATEDEIDGLKAALDDQVVNRNDNETFADRDMAFHLAIARISGNPIFVAVSQAMIEWLRQFRSDLIHVPGAEDLTIKEHKRIFERIAAHDSHGAAKAMADHLNRADRMYRKFEEAAQAKQKASAS